MKKDKAIPQLFGSSHAPPNLTDIEPSYANAGNLPIKKKTVALLLRFLHRLFPSKHIDVKIKPRKRM